MVSLSHTARWGSWRRWSVIAQLASGWLRRLPLPLLRLALAPRKALLQSRRQWCKQCKLQMPQEMNTHKRRCCNGSGGLSAQDDQSPCTTRTVGVPNSCIELRQTNLHATYKIVIQQPHYCIFKPK